MFDNFDLPSLLHTVWGAQQFGFACGVGTLKEHFGNKKGKPF